MIEHATILITLSVIFGFYMAWSIGANDVANAMGTSVGSGALTLKRAVICAAILEFAGAYLVGSHVTETVRKGIIDVTWFEGKENLLVYGMLASLLAAAAWLQLASYFGWPVSTTHSIVGAIVGFGAVSAGVDAVHWGELGKVVSSWLVSPLLAGAISYIIFTFMLKFIFYAAKPVAAARRATPILVFCVFFVMTLVTVYKGLKNLGLDKMDGGQALGIATGISLLCAVISFFIVSRRKRKREAVEQPTASVIYRTRALEKAAKQLRRVELASDPETAKQLAGVLKEVQDLTEQTRTAAADEADDNGLHAEYREVERIFIYLQILSACFVAFAHGANDVANAIGPLSAVITIVETGEIAAKSGVPTWILALGGVGIVVGLATWGWRVIQTIGRRITELTPSRGFAAEFGAATTIVVASRFGLPISTTHTLVGAVLGVGMARGISALNLNTVRDIVASWVITIPAGAGLAILFYYALTMIFT